MIKTAKEPSENADNIICNSMRKLKWKLKMTEKYKQCGKSKSLDAANAKLRDTTL